ncbi:cysteine--tRNA ligase [Patescibacteria group bacterium]|nr:cysteine--tRNA ligase [Patescibacteria group bacterium]MBU1682392.1 cysteine--tRNA ligase [Patescibacteria group bacterium]MBU1934808.1 cysteine--tRNA ligase [Patescibacteria group bacterium]
MKFFNTLTRQKEEFEPAKPDKVGLYCCGPTVYNYAHIGNLRTYVFEDFLRRALEFNGYIVNHVMNITDVGHLTSDADEGEDKMKKGAEREKKTVWEIAEYYTQAFLEDMDRLNLLKPTAKPKATDHVEEMIDQIKQLEENGFTYIGENGNVYYDTSKFEHYKELGQLEKQESEAVARVEVDPNKKNPHDFVLWFVESKHGDQEMQWDSPWGRGFPGWHIECSAMSSRYLGDQFDIHCGGIDHIPVHHTNEIAQAEGASGKHPWVKYWMHGNFLVMKDKEKMAKSGENFLTIATLIQKGYDPMDYRYFCLQSHYRKELAFDWDGVDAARTGFRRLREKVMALGDTEGEIDQGYIDKFMDAISDDLNMPQALAMAWELMDDVSIKDADKLSTIKKMDTVLGLKLDEPIEFELPPQITQWILERNEARDNKDWAKADEIRDKIQESGKWIVKDGAGGTEVVPK